MRNEEPGLVPGDGDRALVALLRRARRRAVVGGLLTGCFGAALLNEAVRWGSVALIIAARSKVLPVVDAGPFFLAVLALILLRRWNLAAVALRVDARLGLRARLTSFLDFRSRADVPDDVRSAQADETLRALAGGGIDPATPLRPWLAAGPALLALSLLYPLFLSSGVETPLVRLAQRVAPRLSMRSGGPPPDGAADPRADAGTQARENGAPSPTRPHGEPGTEETSTPSSPDPETVAKNPAQSGQPGGNPALESDRTVERPSPDRQSPPRDDVREPAHIESQRVGTSLARVVDPLFTPGRGSAPPPPPLSGTLSYHLLPKLSRGSGAGEGQALEGTVPERITLDLDTIPERYRPVVRAYFDRLAQVRAGDAVPPSPTKETTR